MYSLLLPHLKLYKKNIDIEFGPTASTERCSIRRLQKPYIYLEAKNVTKWIGCLRTGIMAICSNFI